MDSQLRCTSKSVLVLGSPYYSGISSNLSTVAASTINPAFTIYTNGPDFPG